MRRLAAAWDARRGRRDVGQIELVAEARRRDSRHSSSNTLGGENTRPEFARLRAASQRAELDVDGISLLGLSARGSVTDRAQGVVRFRFSYVDPDGAPAVHIARATIQGNGDWRLNNDRVPAQLARCGGYL